MHHDILIYSDTSLTAQFRHNNNNYEQDQHQHPLRSCRPCNTDVERLRTSPSLGICLRDWDSTLGSRQQDVLEMPAIESIRASTRWATRVIPVLLTAAGGYATYVVVAPDYLIHTRSEDGTAIAILVLYFLFLLLMIATYLKTITAVNFDTGVVPLGPLAIERRKNQSKTRRSSSAQQDLEGLPYLGPDPNPDSPGLELFYTKDVFVCESDGRPKWCSECCNWKPDRAHHSSEIGRCVYRMDHYCPWVGGMVAETSFKFFIQFTMYTAAYCAIVLGATASSLRKQINEGKPLDPYLLAAMVLAAFFGLFTFLMTVTSMRYIFLNMTNIDNLNYRSKVYQLAVRVPNGTQSTDKFATITYPLPKPGQEINRSVNGGAVAGVSEGHHSGAQSEDNNATNRDRLASRTFAILKTEPGENPWDIGSWRNWQSVMGSNPFDWFLPIRKSPCVNHEDPQSYYPMGPVLSDVCKRYGIPNVVTTNEQGNGVEMEDIGNRHR
ncbi:zf-DHHC-domain-containing protein [Xylariomycetidae sp. FL2044]|nr:zf-DHHC-domain-containing protein [Xylariomycetidae sp. FL2044]